MNTQQKDPKDSHVCLALIDGQILEYDTCDPKGPRPFIYPEDRWKYLGEGTTWIGAKTRLHFGSV